MKREDNHLEEIVPSEEEDKNYNGALRLIQSEDFTPEMAINYLYQWRSNSKLLEALLQKFYFFFKKGNLRQLPTTM
jgi:hypothetical protein